MIQGEVRRINRILEDILFVARPLQLMLAPQLLPPILDTVLQRCQPQITENNVTVSVEYADNLPQVNADDERLEQVFTNLVINATQAMEDGGQLDVLVRQDNKDVVVTISDTGPGIPVDTQQQIFEPFFTTKAKGTGLGLSVARRIIEGHNGTINFESSPDTGTSFIIQIPTCGGSAL